MPGWDESYPLLSNALAPEYRALPREHVESIVEGVFGPGTSLEDAEGFFDDLGHTLSNVARVAGPVVQRALPGVISGAASGAALGPYGMLAGALLGGATSALGSGQAAPAAAPGAPATGTAAPAGATAAGPTPAPAAAGSMGAIGALLGALGSPTVQQALNAMLMGRAGAQTTQTASGGSVPVGAVTNMLGTLAGHASAEWEALWPSTETESYGEGLDVASPEARAEWLYGELAPVPAESRDDETWLDEVYDELDAEFLAQEAEAYDEDYESLPEYGWSAWSSSSGG